MFGGMTFGTKKLYHRVLLLVASWLLLLSWQTSANSNSDVKDWLAAQHTNISDQSLIKKITPDTTYFTGSLDTRLSPVQPQATKIDFQKAQTKYREYQWRNSWDKKAVTLNMRFLFY